MLSWSWSIIRENSPRLEKRNTSSKGNQLAFSRQHGKPRGAGGRREKGLISQQGLCSTSEQIILVMNMAGLSRAAGSLAPA